MILFKLWQFELSEFFELCWIINIFHYFYHKNVRNHKVLYIKMISRKRRLILVFVNVFINCFWKKFIILIFIIFNCILLVSGNKLICCSVSPLYSLYLGYVVNLSKTNKIFRSKRNSNLKTFLNLLYLLNGVTSFRFSYTKMTTMA